MIKLLYITNNIIEAGIVDKLGIEWIFLDLEVHGKAERQAGRDTVLSNHSINDVDAIGRVIKKAKILVRCNPISHLSEQEFEQINDRSSNIDAVMLPYFSTPDEVQVFLDLLDTDHIKPILLVETMGAINNLTAILSMYPFEYLHIGLNDLHIERQTASMFEPYVDGLLSDVVSTLHMHKQRFGIGGIGKIGSDLSPSPKSVLNELVRLQSDGVILSRSFKGAFSERNAEQFEAKLSESIKALRRHERHALNCSDAELIASYDRMKLDIEALRKKC